MSVRVGVQGVFACVCVCAFLVSVCACVRVCPCRGQGGRFCACSIYLSVAACCRGGPTRARLMITCHASVTHLLPSTNATPLCSKRLEIRSITFFTERIFFVFTGRGRGSRSVARWTSERFLYRAQHWNHCHTKATIPSVRGQKSSNRSFLTTRSSPARMQEHFVSGGERSDQLFYALTEFFLRQTGRDHGPGTLSLWTSQRFVVGTRLFDLR